MFATSSDGSEIYFEVTGEGGIEGSPGAVYPMLEVPDAFTAALRLALAALRV